MYIIGIDPGYAIVGVGIVDSNSGKFRTPGYGAIITHADMEFNKRLSKIYDELTQLLQKYKPKHAAVEKLFFQNNQKTAIQVAEARGVIMLALEQNGVKVFEYTPLQVKSAVTGYGKAEKIQVIEMTKRLLGLKEAPKPDDVADALALAICHAQVHKRPLVNIRK